MPVEKDSKARPVMCLIEPGCEGHRAFFVEAITHAALGAGWTVNIVLTRKSDHPIYDRMRTRFKNCDNIAITICDIDPPSIQRRSGVIYLAWRNMRLRSIYRRCYLESVRRFAVDAVFMPYIDNCAYAASIVGMPFGATPSIACTVAHAETMISTNYYFDGNKKLTIKGRLFRRLLMKSNLRKMFVLDERLIGLFDSYSPRKIEYLPDPTVVLNSRKIADARKQLDIDPASTVVLVYGAIVRRKAIDSLVSAAANIENVALLLAGKVDKEVKDWLASNSLARRLYESGRLYMLDRFINDRETESVFSASDIAWLGYRNHLGPSGVVNHACSYGLPVIGCREGVIGDLINKRKIGISVDINNLSEVKKAIIELRNNKKLREDLGQNGCKAARGEGFAQFCLVLEDALNQLGSGTRKVKPPA